MEQNIDFDRIDLQFDLLSERINNVYQIIQQNDKNPTEVIALLKDLRSGLSEGRELALVGNNEAEKRHYIPVIDSTLASIDKCLENPSRDDLLGRLYNAFFRVKYWFIPPTIPVY